MSEKMPFFKKWESLQKPKSILFIRLQALGDVTITLPYIQGFKKLYPDSRVDFITRDEVADIACSIQLFDNVYVLKGGRKTWKQALSGFVQLLRLYKNDYDVIIDLQNNWISRFIRKALFSKAWSKFDRFSSIAAGERVARAITTIGLGTVQPDFTFRIKSENNTDELLKYHGWKPGHELVVLNPAGFFETRNWPLDNYVKFAELWLSQFPTTQFLILGIERIKNKAGYFKEELGDKLINLAGLTSQAEAFVIIQKAKLVLSEDSGLMHMAWTSGKATVALFGSSRSDWSRPLGAHSICLDSSDLECGECMQAHCKFGDVHCLTRHTPEIVFNQSLKLIESLST